MNIVRTCWHLLLLCLGVLHAKTVGPLVDWLDEGLLGCWEESVKLFIREFFVSATRLINGACAWMLAFSDSNYRESLRCAWKQKEAWHSWWREERQSTLNAVLAQTPAGNPSRRKSLDFGLRSLHKPRAKRSSHIGWSNLKPTDTQSSSSEFSNPTSTMATAAQMTYASKSPMAAAAATTATEATATDASKGGVSNTGSKGSSSWVARTVTKLQAWLVGRSKVQPMVATAAGCGSDIGSSSSNPLLPTPSLPTLPSLPSERALPLLVNDTVVDNGNVATAASVAFDEPADGKRLTAVYREVEDTLAHTAKGQQQDQQQVAAATASHGKHVLAECGKQQQLQQQQAVARVTNFSAAQPNKTFRKGSNSQAHCTPTSSIHSSSGSGGRRTSRLHWLQLPLWVVLRVARILLYILFWPVTFWWGIIISPFYWRVRLQRQPSKLLHSKDANAFGPFMTADPTGLVAPPAAASSVSGFGRRQRYTRRSIVFEQPAGFGAHESSKRRGLLEELRLGSELGVTASFDAMRLLVRVLTLTKRRGKRPNKLAAVAAAKQQQQQQRKLAAAAASKGQLQPADSRGKVQWGNEAATDQQQQQQPDATAFDHISVNQGCGSCAEGLDVAWDQQQQHGSSGRHQGLTRSKSAGSDLAELRRGTAPGSSALPRLTMRRVHSVGRWRHIMEDQAAAAAAAASDGSSSRVHGDWEWPCGDDELSPAAQIILKAGYPLELHIVTTADGYVLRMERIPRPGCSRVAFFMHGILDTSLTWVSSGVTGSQAFAAWDQGFDVWLGSSRSNPPRLAKDPSKQGLGYFSFSLNELGIYDMPAQLDHLHSVKIRELAGSSLANRGAAAEAKPSRPQQVAGDGHSAQSYMFDLRQFDPLLVDPSHSSQAFGPHGQHCGQSGQHSTLEAVFATPAAAVAKAANTSSSCAHGVEHLSHHSSFKRALSDSRLDSMDAEYLLDPPVKQQHMQHQSRRSLHKAAAAATVTKQKGGVAALQRLLTAVGSSKQQSNKTSSNGKKRIFSSSLLPRSSSNASNGTNQVATATAGQPAIASSQFKALLQRHLQRTSMDSSDGCGSEYRLQQPNGHLAIEQQQQQQQQLLPVSAAKGAHSCTASATSSAAASVSDKGSEIYEPSTPEVLESPWRLDALPAEAPVVQSDGAPSGTAAGNSSSNGSVSNGSVSNDSRDSTVYEAGGKQHQQQQQQANCSSTMLLAARSTSPFSVFSLQQAALAGMPTDTATTAAAFNNNSNTWGSRGPSSTGATEKHQHQQQQQQQQQLLPVDDAVIAAAICGHDDQQQQQALGPAAGSCNYSTIRNVSLRRSRSCSDTSAVVPGSGVVQQHSRQPLHPMLPLNHYGIARCSSINSSGGRCYSSSSACGSSDVSSPRDQQRKASPDVSSATYGDVQGAPSSKYNINGRPASGVSHQAHAAAAAAQNGKGSSGSGTNGNRSNIDSSSSSSSSHSRPLANGTCRPGMPTAAPIEPYDLKVVAHSLGGMSMLVYLVMRCAAGQPHHVRRLVLMSPAGFHNKVPRPWWPFILALPWWHKLLVLCVGKERAYHPAVLPTYIARALAFSYMAEIARLPALADFTRAVMKAFFGGDASEWERALLMPHYSATGMPACGLHQALHFIQIIHAGRFQLFDYGSTAANIARYGTPRPPDIGAQYWRLAGLPVDLMAGSNDGIIPPSNVHCHYDRMKDQGVQVSYREFAYGHMDFTFSVKDELRYYVMQCLNRKP